MRLSTDYCFVVFARTAKRLVWIRKAARLQNKLQGRTIVKNNKPITFSRQLFALVLPITFQSLISSLVNLADVVMLGSVSQSALSAVSLAGQVTFVLMLFYFGISSGVGILTAQYWGKGDLLTIERVLGIGSGFSVAVSSLFFLAALIIPESLMTLLTPDRELITLGASYLRILSVSYLFMSLSQIYLGMLKSMGLARLSASISSVSLIFDTAVTAIVVFVLYPNDPPKAVMGVAFATTLTRLVEFTLCLLHSVMRGKVKLRLIRVLHFDKVLLHDFIKYAAPAQSNYLVWGGALATTTAIMGYVSSDMVAANSLASVVKNLVLVLCSGVAQGGSVLIGKSLGEGNIKEAKRSGGKVVQWALAFGVLAGLLILLIRPYVPAVADLTDDAKHILDGMLLICSYYCIGKSLNSTVIAGIFFAGGDSRFGFLCDTIVMWGIIIPVGFLCAFVFKLPPVALYAVLCMDEFVKLPIMAIHYKKYKWLKNITRDKEALAAIV